MTAHQSSVEDVKTFLRSNNLDECIEKVIEIGGDSLLNLSYATPEILKTNGIEKIWARYICRKMKKLKIMENWSSINKNSVEEFFESIGMSQYGQIMVKNLRVVNTDMLQDLEQKDMLDEDFLELHVLRIWNIIQTLFKEESDTTDLDIQEKISLPRQSIDAELQELNNMGKEFAKELAECCTCKTKADSQAKKDFGICYYCESGGVVCSKHIREHDHNYINCVIPFSVIFEREVMESNSGITCGNMKDLYEKITDGGPNTRYCEFCNRLHESTAYNLCRQCCLVMDRDCLEKYHLRKDYNNHQIVQFSSFIAKTYLSFYHQVATNNNVLSQTAISGSLIAHSMASDLPLLQLNKGIIKSNLSMVSRASHSLGHISLGALRLSGITIGAGVAVLALDIACLAKKWLWDKEITCMEFFKSTGSSITKNGIIITCSAIGSGVCPIIGSILGAIIGIAVVKGLEWFFKTVDQEKTTAVIAAIDLGVIQKKNFASTRYECFFYYDKDLKQITIQDVKRCFKQRIREVHPDKNQSATSRYEEFQEKAAKLILAKEILIHYLQTSNVPNSDDDTKVSKPITLLSSN